MNEKETNSKTPVYIYEGRIKISYKKHKTNLEILLNIENGWHINTNNPKQTYLKPTIIEISKKHDINEDIKITSLHFPKGKNRTFGKENLEVYENNTTIKVALNKEILKPLELEIQLQACSDKNCLPPEKITFIVY
jgi:thiol:disulfide interchange protein